MTRFLEFPILFIMRPKAAVDPDQLGRVELSLMVDEQRAKHLRRHARLLLLHQKTSIGLEHREVSRVQRIRALVCHERVLLTVKRLAKLSELLIEPNIIIEITRGVRLLAGGLETLNRWVDFA